MSNFDILLHYVSQNDVYNAARLLEIDSSSLNRLDSTGLSLLHYASKKGAMSMVDLLLKNGADVNVVSDKKKTDGATCLHEAARSNQYRIARLLIEHRANVDLTDNNKQTPMHIAAFENRADIVSLLLSACADSSITDKHGFPARLHALKNGHNEVAALIPETKMDMWTELKKDDLYQYKIDYIRSEIEKKEKKKAAKEAKKKKK